jgi:hypothetical protein
LDKEPSIREFMSEFTRASHATKVLAIGYYLEVLEGKEPFDVGDIREGYLSAKLSPSSNISAEISTNLKRSLMLSPQRGKYALTQPGSETIRGLLQMDAPQEIRERISEKLRSNVLTIADADEREYIEEALKCLDVEAYRGAILMGWAACVDNLYRKIEQAGLGAFHQACAQFMKNPRVVRTRNDLEYYKDSDVLQAAERMGLYDRNVRAALKRQLDLRNRSGHPGEVKPQVHVANAFFEEIIQYVLSVA